VALTLGVGVGLSAFAQSERVRIEAEPGFAIVWDGNNGGFSSGDPGVGPGENEALGSKGTVAFASSSFLPGGVHDAINVNDGYYGNSSSWIADFTVPDPMPFIGLRFGRTVNIESVAWSRDNGDDVERTPPGPYTDRAVGVYTLQITRVTDPDETTSETGDAASGWVTVGTIELMPGADGPLFSAYLRHRFDLSAEGGALAATGLRLLVSDVGLCIDEIEVNPPSDPNPPISDFITVQAASGFGVGWDGNDGAFRNPETPAAVPDNRALASRGTVAFGSSEFGAGHLMANVNDGFYGNSRSWIAHFGTPDPDPYIGLDFGEEIVVRQVAWSRDNGDDVDNCCDGEATDRALGVYTVQITRVGTPETATTETGDPATGWVTVGTVEYKAAGDVFRPHLRHAFSLTEGGQPLRATGLRLKVSDPGMAIDELEVNVNPALMALAEGLIVLTPEAGFTLEWDGNDGDFFSPAVGAAAPDNAALAARGATAFGSGQLFPPGSVHAIAHVIDGLYGNAASWIPGDQEVDPEVNPEDGAYVGVRFGETVPVSSIAWGRDNGNNAGDCCGGQLTDRWEGTYTVQLTTVSDPGVATAVTGDSATGWVTVGTVTYTGSAAPDFNPWLRHRFDVARDGSAIPATALRLLVSGPGTCVDEIEVNPAEATRAPIEVVAAAGYLLEWNGNQGRFSTTHAPASAPDNEALASRGTVAFGSSEFGGPHVIAHIHDGLYGNDRSWIARFTEPVDPDPYIGLRFGRTVDIRNVAWSRDNGNDMERTPPGPYEDRAVGAYTLQITTVPEPGVETVEATEASSGWVTVGTVTYTGQEDLRFVPHLRHKFDVAGTNGLPVAATGLRIKVSDAGMAMDELEVNVALAEEGEVLELQGFHGVHIAWDGNDGDFYSPDDGASAPDNLALASQGTTAFGSSEFGLDVHLVNHIHDGLYGNSRSWIADFTLPDPTPFVGVNFGQLVTLGSVAWGRDNGNDPGDCCGGQLMDRWAGVYTLQITTLSEAGVDTEESEDASTGWLTVATVQYKAAQAPAFRPWLRHRFDLSREGAPLTATALRIKVSDVGTCIDELEVFAPAASAPVLAVARGMDGWVIQWNGGGTLQSAATAQGPWNDVVGASSGHVVVLEGDARFYRVRE
jgi:hypothetical protein